VAFGSTPRNAVLMVARGDDRTAIKTGATIFWPLYADMVASCNAQNVNKDIYKYTQAVIYVVSSINIYSPVH
jgi:hypothetical protein